MGNAEDLIFRSAALKSLGEPPPVWTESDYEIGMQVQWTSDFNAIKNVSAAHQNHIADADKKGDLISRQAAIDALDKRFDDVPRELTTEILLLRKDLREVIPSAQPEERTNERTETHACDLISRQAAIDAMAKALWYYPNACYRNLNEYEFAKGLAELGLKSVPPAQSEPFVDADKLKRCRFEYVNACKIVARPTPDTSKNDIYDANAVIKALHPIFGDAEF